MLRIWIFAARQDLFRQLADVVPGQVRERTRRRVDLILILAERELFDLLEEVLDPLTHHELDVPRLALTGERAETYFLRSGRSLDGDLVSAQRPGLEQGGVFPGRASLLLDRYDCVEWVQPGTRLLHRVPSVRRYLVSLDVLNEVTALVVD